MVSSTFFAACLLSCVALTTASPTRRAVSPYVPVPATCPSTPLVRKATGISTAEANYIKQRYQKASASLETWLKSVDSSFECGHGGWGGHGNHAKGSKAPVVALTSSGGGYRALLAGAGVIKGLDAREDLTPVGGVFQSVTYESGLSGGAWLLSSFAGNNWPTISSVQSELWEPAFQADLLVPQILLSPQAAPIYSAVAADVAAKGAAGFTPTLTDPWGRLLAYGLLLGPDGGVKDTISGITAYSNFTSHNVPYPIITALGVNTFEGLCAPLLNATQYEFHPYEFGSWDIGVEAFASAKYLGTSFSDGKPNGTCYTGYDNLGYVLGTSSNLFFTACGPIPAANTTAASSLALAEDLAELVAPGAPGVPERADFAPYPNPFHNFASSPLVSAQTELDLVDGGVSLQNNPIWPMLHRDVDVIIVNDNSADTVDNFPNGTEILTTYLVANASGLTRMPAIPSVATFVSEHLNQKPTFFGCNTPNTATIVYIPNFNYTFPSNEPTLKLQYFKNETDGMIANGVETANYGGKQDWPLCLGCGIMKKSGEKLPAGCAACFEEYCYN